MVTTQITPKGQRLLEKLEDAVCQEHEEWLGHLSKAELKQLIALLSAVRQGE